MDEWYLDVVAMKWRHIYLFGAARTEQRKTTTKYTQNKRKRDDEAALLAADTLVKLQRRYAREAPDVHTPSH